MADVQYKDIVANQQGKTPDQLASQAQAETLPNTITGDTLKNTGAVDVPKTDFSSVGSGASALVAGVTAGQKNLEQYIKDNTPATSDTPYQNKANELFNSINTIAPDLLGRGEYQTQQDSAAGVPQLSRQLQEANNATLISNAEYAKLQAEQQAKKDALEAGSRGISTGILTGQQGAVDRQYNSELALKSAEGALSYAKAQAIAGNLTVAQGIANKAVDAKYKDQELLYDHQLKQLDALAPFLSAEQTKISEARKQMVDDQKTALEEKKQNEKDIQSIALQAAGNGASEGLMKMITEAKDSKTAMQLATPYLAKVETQVVEVGGHSKLIDSKTGKVLQDLGVSNSVINANTAHSTAANDATTNALLATAGSDGKVDPQAYLKQRAASKLTAKEFDAKFGSYLSSQEQKNLGVSGGDGVSQYQIDTNARISQSVSELLPLVSSTTVGPVAKASYRVPGTPAYNFNAQLQTLKSNIAFGALTQMREASKTGGALGQVSDKESSLLESSLAALDIGQSPAQFTAQLQKIQGSINRFNAAATGTQPTQPSGGTTVMTDANGNSWNVPNDQINLFKQNGYK